MTTSSEVGGKWSPTAGRDLGPLLVDFVTSSPLWSAAMRKAVVCVALACFVAAGCGSESQGAGDEGVESNEQTTTAELDRTTTTTSTTTTSTTTTTTIPAEQTAFEAEYAKMPAEMQRNFDGVPSSVVAVRICGDAAELMFVGKIGVEHYPDVARAGYAWKCPERVAAHDKGVLDAIAEDARRKAAATSTVPPTTKPPSRVGSGSGSVYYANCSAARAAGAAPVYRGDPGYGSHLDRDGDGVGCE